MELQPYTSVETERGAGVGAFTHRVPPEWDVIKTKVVDHDQSSNDKPTLCYSATSGILLLITKAPQVDWDIYKSVVAIAQLNKTLLGGSVRMLVYLDRRPEIDVQGNQWSGNYLAPTQDQRVYGGHYFHNTPDAFLETLSATEVVMWRVNLKNEPLRGKNIVRISIW